MRAFESCLWPESWTLIWRYWVFLEIHRSFQIDFLRLHWLTSHSCSTIFHPWWILRLADVYRIEPNAEWLINLFPIRILIGRHRPWMFELTRLDATFEFHLGVKYRLLFPHDIRIIFIRVCPCVLRLLLPFSLWLNFLQESSLSSVHSLFHLLLLDVLFDPCLEKNLWLRALWWFHFDFDRWRIRFARLVWFCIIQLFRRCVWLLVVDYYHFYWCSWAFT